jgi:glutathione synthase
MDLRHLFIIDPLASIHPEGDTSVAFMRAAVARGDEVFVAEQSDLGVRVGGALSARATPLTLAPASASSSSWYTAGAAVEVSADDVQIVWMRKDPPVDEVFLTTTMLLERHDPKKTLVLNNPASLRLAHEKLWALQYPELVPAQVVTARRDVLKAFVDEHGMAVVKPLAFMGGMGVMVFSKEDKNLKSAIDLLTQEGKKPAIAQAYLKDVRIGDKRVIVIDGEPIAALLRVPKDDDVRANLHVGGGAAQVDVDDNDRRICAVLAPELKRLGLFFVGLDVIGGKLTEVNVTSPTGIATIDAIEGRTGERSIATIVVERAAAKYAAQVA